MEIKRDFYLKQLIEKKENGRIKIITGIRRCGKSYLLDPIYSNYLKLIGVGDSQIIKVSFKGDENLSSRDPIRLGQYIRSLIKNNNKMYYIFMDEIQKVNTIKNPYLEEGEKITFLDVLLGLKNIKNADVYVTGSNSVMLSSDVLTSFRDRGDEIRVNPLNYKEFCEFKGSFNDWDEYTLYGGMPLAVLAKTKEEKSKYLKKLFYETYLKDIIERNKISNDVEIVDDLLNIIASNIGSFTNPSKLSKVFKSKKNIMIKPETIGNYLKYFIEAFIINKSYRYDIKGNKYIDTPLKYYFTDIGLRNAKIGFRQVEQSHIMENVIYNELLIRGFDVDVGCIETYSKNNNVTKRNHYEVDFVANKGSERYYIQSALEINSEEKLQQEINSLIRIKDSFKKVVIVNSKKIPQHDNNGILFISLSDFLLKEDALDW